MEKRTLALFAAFAFFAVLASAQFCQSAASGQEYAYAGDSQQPSYPSDSMVVKNTIYIGPSIEYSNLGVLERASEEGAGVKKTDTGYIYKSRYAPDRWVEIGKTDSGSSYISIIKVVGNSSAENAGALENGSLSNVPQPPAAGGAMPAMNSPPPPPPASRQGSSESFDSGDAQVASQELEYLYKNNIAQDNSLNSVVTAISGLVGSPAGYQQAAATPPSPPVAQQEAISPSELPKTVVDFSYGVEPQSPQSPQQGSGTQAFTAQDTGAASKTSGAGSGSRDVAGDWADNYLGGFGGIAAIIGVLTIGLLIAAVAAFVVMQLTGIFKQPDISQIEDFKVLSNGTRFEILACLAEADRIPTDISLMLNKSKSTISEHLDKLMEAGFVEKQQADGKKFVYYRLTSKGKSALRSANKYGS
ncbi:MAG: winged helix-turn-helix domain-containing protein [Candidatus Micrarchaeia archaeon]